MDVVELAKVLGALSSPVVYLAGVIYLFRLLREDQKQNKSDLEALINRYHEQQDENVITLREIVEKLEKR
jgi:hypothetical protein